MTEQERQSLYEAIQRNAPRYFDKMKQRLDLQRKMINDCIRVASQGDNPDYKEDINKIYNSCRVRLNENELILLNYICLIKYRESAENGIREDNSDIRRWIGILTSCIEEKDSNGREVPVIGILKRHARRIIKKYEVKNCPGRPKGSGKRVFSYNGKEYHTIQECADDYNITRQGMHKKLRKLQII